MCGSSPLMRGKRRRRRPVDPPHGLIPAHAGKTPSFMASAKGWRAHPRSHGENIFVALYENNETGSSPLMRGKLTPEILRIRRDRLIPTNARKTATHRPGTRNGRAHSRSRGDNFWILPLAPGIAGSSPLTRGKRILGQGDTLSDGLIPAHAGKTLSSSPPGVKARAHPRSRGENFQIGMPRSASWGSSPLTRGKLGDRPLADRESGLIPAHTGKTTNRGARTTGTRAHPRSRGENGTALTAAINPTGSSPLTRGKPCREGTPCVPEGLIPTHEGKTLSGRSWLASRPTHPRSRGENTGWLSEGGHHYGSSPLTRGKRATSRQPFDASRAHPRSHGENEMSNTVRAPETSSSPLTRGKPALPS